MKHKKYLCYKLKSPSVHKLQYIIFHHITFMLIWILLALYFLSTLNFKFCDLKLNAFGLIIAQGLLLYACTYLNKTIQKWCHSTLTFWRWLLFELEKNLLYNVCPLITLSKPRKCIYSGTKNWVLWEAQMKTVLLYQKWSLLSSSFVHRMKAKTQTFIQHQVSLSINQRFTASLNQQALFIFRVSLKYESRRQRRKTKLSGHSRRKNIKFPNECITWKYKPFLLSLALSSISEKDVFTIRAEIWLSLLHLHFFVAKWM